MDWLLPLELTQEAWNGNPHLKDEWASCVWDDGCGLDSLGHMVNRIQLRSEGNGDYVEGDEDVELGGMDHDDGRGVEDMDSLDHNNFVLLSYLDDHDCDDWRVVLK